MADIIDRLCIAMRENGASDLFLQEGRVAQIRLGGKLMELGDEPVSAETLADFWKQCGAGEGDLDRDTAIHSSDGGRFRVNLLRTLGRRSAVLREIKTIVPELETLHLPVELLTGWIARQAGLILVTGRTGSGKSTTIASCLQWLNLRFPRHVVTIEDPIEYLFENSASLFSQREVGIDTDSFAEGMRRSLRQSPDVIFVGEIRDLASASTALQAAETGHLVVTTLHSANVAETLERFIQIFPASDRQGAQRILGSQLIGILCQQLVPTREESLIPALEYLQNEGVSRKYIQEGRSLELNDIIARGEEGTARSFMNSLAQLVQSGIVSQEVAMQYCENPHELSRALRGISSGSPSRT